MFDYFQLMNHVDEWIIFDKIQFIDKGWINRNRILHTNPEKDWQFITIPLSKRGQFDYINEISIIQNQKWNETIMGKLTTYRKAPYYRETKDFVYECLFDSTESLTETLEKTLIKTAKHLGIETPTTVQSRQDWQLPAITHPGQWALEISKLKKASKYINLYGGSNIFQQKEFDAAGIELQFLKPKFQPYTQYRKCFIEGLSILDVLMWNDKNSIREMLKNDFSLLNKEQVENE
ncbi:WbqC family protein [Vreelandella lionensis]|uniref:WbqC family protein n=1 Tax=Vreelandella lionensis TaxID=1144478 RepID=UPI0024371C0D|nr:WbqC family protein [Halomonas lionensis]